MILLQATATNETYYLIEVFIVILVIIIQLVHSVKLYVSIQKLRTIFIWRLTIKNGFIEKSVLRTKANILSLLRAEKRVLNIFDDESDEPEIQISLVDTLGNNDVITRIKNTLNSYLINNFGAAVNFSIIKDIIDREVDVKDEEISQSIPTPLYLGLAATMIGIIFGLLAMPKLNGDGFADGINALIDGVKLAMFASLTGLLFTTLLSSYFYKRAKRVVMKDKNDQLSYLQAELLPELVRAEDTGVSGLKASLDRFAREATKISNNVKIAANQTGLNLQAQLDVITKVENLNMTRVSKANLELFDRLEASMEAFNRFSTYLEVMNKISENLVSFSNRTENFETIANEIRSTLSESKELSKFLTTHFQKIEQAGGAALVAVNLSHSSFKEAIEILTNDTNARISALNNLSDNSESTLKATFEQIGTDLNAIVEKHINSLTYAYKNSTPHFDHLDHLKLLPEFRDKSVNQSRDLISAVNQLTSSNKKDNQSLMAKLDNIEKRFTGIIVTPRIGFFKRLKNMFTRKNKSSNYEA